MSSSTTARRRRPTDVERRRRAHSWFDRIAVERALRDWALDETPTQSAGRPLSRRERRIVTHALLAVGETRAGIARLLRAGETTVKMLSEEPPAGGSRTQHRADVAWAVALLECRHQARERIATRYQPNPISSAEAARIVGLAIGCERLPDQIFNPRFVAPR